MTAPTQDPAVEPETKPAGDPPADPKPADTKPDEPLGDGGKKALDSERAKNKELEKELTKFRKVEQDRADADKTEAEKRTAAEQRAAAAELRATRLEVAAEKGLSTAQAKYLSGANREELEAKADEILKDFPASAQQANPSPKPDPSQGSKGDVKGRPTSLGAAVAQHYAPR